MKTARQQLDELLRETPAAARVRQQSAFDNAVSGRRRIVIFGAGHLAAPSFGASLAPISNPSPLPTTIPAHGEQPSMDFPYFLLRTPPSSTRTTPPSSLPYGIRA